MRLLMAVSVMMSITSAVALYMLGNETRRLEISVRSQVKQADNLRGEISVLKAERTFLARPERIAPLARALGLGPARPDQYATSLTPTQTSDASADY